MLKKNFPALVLGGRCWRRAGSSPAPRPGPTSRCKLVLSQPPGSGPDNVARLLGERLAPHAGARRS